MKRWIAIGAASFGIFALGGAAGVAFENSAKAQMYRTMCLSLFDDRGSGAIRTMVLLANGRTDDVYDLAERAALICASPTSRAQLKQSHPELLDCYKGLKAFYDHFPERKANLVRLHPVEAAMLGFEAAP